ncbi:MAG: GntR family transcriptional regulator, N-acetylglucosamine utilization regulator [Solirubrobacteraceae bacterium]|nr:GntR family transcriptional regulator, N-acetylglucosamine utilization regulator [Solirubrobacteraceae bacterium]
MALMPASGRILKNSAIPFYEQLKQILLEAIRRERMEPGAVLPTEAELCEMYGVSRTVVRQAIGDLVNEGRLYRMQGKGTFVARPAPRSQFMESTVGFFEEPPHEGAEVTRRVLRCELVEPPEELASLLGFAPGEEAVHVDRLRLVDGFVVSLSRHYLVQSLRPDLLSDLREWDHASRSLYDFLEEVCGAPIYSGHRTLEAVATPQEVAELLELEPDAPALFVRSVSRDAQGRPVEAHEAWHRGDRAQFDIDVAGRPRSQSVM